MESFGKEPTKAPKPAEVQKMCEVALTALPTDSQEEGGRVRRGVTCPEDAPRLVNMPGEFSLPKSQGLTATVGMMS